MPSMALWCRFFVEAGDEARAREVVARVEALVQRAAPGCLLEVECVEPYWKVEGQWQVRARVHPPAGADPATMGRLLLGALGRGWDREWPEEGGDCICATNAGGEVAVEGVTWINLFLAGEPDHRA